MKIQVSISIVLLLVPVPFAAATEVVPSDDVVAVRATGTPVSDVLEELARRTGVTVIYDGPPPRELVTVDRVSRTPAEAISSLLEGLGLSYVLKMDATGTQVDTLLVAGRSKTGPTSPPALPGRAERHNEEWDESGQTLTMPEPVEEVLEGDLPIDAEEEPDVLLPDSLVEALAAALAAGEEDAVEALSGPAQLPLPDFARSPFAPNPPDLFGPATSAPAPPDAER